MKRVREIHAREENKKIRSAMREAGILENEGPEHGILKSRLLGRGRGKKEIEVVDGRRGGRNGGDEESGCFSSVYYDKD